ncbi:MAG TPA: ImmA/IrrE family metallo-endopeptidase [Polyangiaceae bacterium]|nr:ImmA/IrrE family metallo-endopeptidase [Polyangiaceae bacterium]
MAINQEELGQRLKRAREACSMTQDDVAGHLEVSRSTVAQMELGNRAVTGLELSRLAYLYGKDLRGFVADEAPAEEDVLVALFRLHPELASQDDVLEALRVCMELGRELTGLERLLGIDRDLATVASYPLPAPRTKWDAIQQGQRIALEERRRLGLGQAPLPDVAELLEAQGVRTAQVSLPDDISGLTLIEPEIGVFVVANREHHLLRRRFSYAHEYCHVLLDRDQRGLVSRGQDRNELLEVRANAFAASFLMPADAVRQFVQALGKGQPSRMEAEVFDEEAPVRARARATPGSQDIQIYDVVQVAHRFGVSRTAACYRLKSARLLTSAELDDLLEQDRAGRGRELEKLLGLPEPDHRAQRNEFRRRFLGLALEAFRREEISRAKLIEVAAMVGASARDVDQATLGMDDGEGAELRLPGG